MKGFSLILVNFFLHLPLIFGGPLTRFDERRKPCVDYFRDVQNPCADNPERQLYFRHRSDNSKFIQCDRYDRMYVIQCPQDSLFVSGFYCTRPLHAGISLKNSTDIPSCTDPFQNVTNPCTDNPDFIVYFPYSKDETKAIQCDKYGRMYILQCPRGFTYDDSKACRKHLSTILSSLTTSEPSTKTRTTPALFSTKRNTSLYFPVSDTTSMTSSVEESRNWSVLFPDSTTNSNLFTDIVYHFDCTSEPQPTTEIIVDNGSHGGIDQIVIWASVGITVSILVLGLTVSLICIYRKRHNKRKGQAERPYTYKNTERYKSDNIGVKSLVTGGTATCSVDPETIINTLNSFDFNTSDETLSEVFPENERNYETLQTFSSKPSSGYEEVHTSVSSDENRQDRQDRILHYTDAEYEKLHHDKVGQDRSYEALESSFDSLNNVVFDDNKEDESSYAIGRIPVQKEQNYTDSNYLTPVT